jgi:hypothetical protein
MPQSLLAAATDPNLAETAAALTRRRSTTPRGPRIPAELWSQAVALSGTHGVSMVARALRLDYDALNRRVMAVSGAVTPEPPAFIELTLGLPGSGPGCVFALSDGQVRALRIAWTRAARGRGRGGGAQPVGLARRVRQALAEDPFGGAVFVFRNRRGTAINLLAYDGQGFWLCQKRLSQGRFRHWPTGQEGQVLATHDLAVLLAGGDWSAAAGAPVWRAVVA